MACKHLPPSLPLLAVSLILLATLSFQFLHSEELRTSSLNSDSENCDVDVELRIANCSSRELLAVPQNLYPDIEDFYLSRNKFTALLNSSFERYNHITHLCLNWNDIRTVESATLRPLKNLDWLELAFNPHLVLPSTGFLRWASKLSSLNLTASGMKSLPNDTFRWSTQLKNVLLTSNDFSAINISSCDIATAIHVDLSWNAIEHINADTFIYVCQSEYLNLQKNPIRSVDPDIIASLRVYHLEISCSLPTFKVLRSILTGIARSEVKELRISDSQFTSFPKDAFDPLQNVSLQSLDLSSNGIKTLYPYIFSNLTRIDVLLLTDNHLQEIEPNYFEGMQDLRKLDLSDNKIKSVNQNSSIWRLNLLELYLSRNELEEISPKTFYGLTNLTILDLSSNRNLATVRLTASAGLTNLQKIDLSHCGVLFFDLDFPMLKSLCLRKASGFCYIVPEREFFKHLQSLEYLDLAYNGLYASRLWGPSLNVSAFDNLTHLSTLDLSGNSFGDPINVLQPGTFRHLSALKDLKIDDCEIGTLPALVFEGLSSLQNLSLRGNLIKHLHYNLLEVLPQLILINLDNNLLGYLDKAIFSNNPKLRTFLLANNKLNSLNQSTFKPVESLLSLLDLSVNPLVCDCNLKWLSVLLKSESLNLKNEEKTICSSASLAPFRENPLKDFDPSELCRLKAELFCLIPLVGISLIVIVVLVYHNRWPLRYKFFLLRLAILGYKEMQDARDHNDYEFDLNIIFYDHDEEWIREHLRPALEERLPQFERNVFGDGDLVWGMHYLDSVDYVVSHSYKTVILLSRAAVRDRWFMLKFRTAMDHVSDTQTEFVVVVFLEDIPDEEQPFLARLYLSDGRPYLFWPDDVRGQGYFWDELAKHLTINLRTND